MKALSILLSLGATSSQEGTYDITEVLPFETSDSRDCTFIVNKILFIHCPGRYFSYKTEKFKETANRGIKDYGSVAPLIGVHEVIAKNPQSHISYVDLSTS